MLLNYSGDSGPLCPNQMTPRHPLHQLHTDLIDAAYAAGDVDSETLEFSTAQAATMYTAIAYKQFDGRMLLYKDAVTAMISGRSEWIETYYFRCTICGLILPANRTV